MNNELKPCPFCGKDPCIETFHVRKGCGVNVYCDECLLLMCSITYDTEQEADKAAISAWNQRVDAPRKTAECPPTEDDGARIDSDWLPGKNSVIAWSAIHKLWVTKKVVSVASYPDDYPFWIPAPPNPEKEDTNHD